MTGWGEKLSGVSAADLREQVTTDGPAKAAWRLVVAIEYKAGLRPVAIEAKYGIDADTVYTWLDRFERRGVAGALADDPRPGRPRKLDGDAWARFVEDLERSPESFGYDAPTWTSSVARRHLSSAYGVEYSTRHVRRLLDRADPED